MFKGVLDRNKEGFYMYKRPWGSFVSENGNANYKLKRICCRIKMDGVRAFIEIGQWHPEVYKVKWSGASNVYGILFLQCMQFEVTLSESNFRKEACLRVCFSPQILNSIGINNFDFLYGCFG